MLAVIKVAFHRRKDKPVDLFCLRRNLDLEIISICKILNYYLSHIFSNSVAVNQPTETLRETRLIKEPTMIWVTRDSRIINHNLLNFL